MDRGHLRLAEIGLRVAGRYGFALAGAYAVQVHGILERPSEDVDLFTAWERRGDFAAAVEAVIDGNRTDGYTVEVIQQFETFARLAVAEPAAPAQDNTTRLREIVDTCVSDPDKLYGPKCGFDQWLATALGANREATTLRVGGLFDLSLRAPLSAVLEVGDQELVRAWEHSAEAATLGTDSDLYELVSRAHVLSILLRGRYHDLVARSAGIQVMHHPVRGPLLPELPEADLQPVPYELTNSERFMAQLLWASGFAERDADRRIRLWADNVRLVRTAVLAEMIDLPHRTSETRALDTAVEAARNAGVRAHSRLVDDGIDLLLAAGVGALTSFVVNGWPDMVATLAAYAGSRKEQLGARVAKQVFDSNRRLRHLAETPGRVTGRFAPPGGPGMADGDA